MSAKSESANNYKSQLDTQHGWKKTPTTVIPLITGDGRPGSIGEMIRNRVQAVSLAGDVRTISAGDIPDHFNALIMCHGVTYLDWIESASPGEVREIVDVNLTGTINLVRAFVNATIKNAERKYIISIGSMAYTKVLNGSSAYCAAKAGLAHFMKCAAWELAPKGYDCFSIHPSNVDDSPMCRDTVAGLRRYRNLTEEEAKAYWGDNYLRGRSLTREEIADTVQFILSGKATFLAGQNFELTGGQR